MSQKLARCAHCDGWDKHKYPTLTVIWSNCPSFKIKQVVTIFIYHLCSFGSCCSPIIWELLFYLPRCPEKSYMSTMKTHAGFLLHAIMANDSWFKIIKGKQHPNKVPKIKKNTKANTQVQKHPEKFPKLD